MTDPDAHRDVWGASRRRGRPVDRAREVAQGRLQAGVVGIADAVLFVLYYRAITFNANQMIREGRPAAVAL